MGLPAAAERASGVCPGDRFAGQSAAMSAAASAFFRSGDLEAVAAFPELPDLRRARALPMAVGGPVSGDGGQRGELVKAGRSE